MDAWLKQTSRPQTSRPQPAAKKASSGSLNYSKFDRIVDSDDEEEEKQRRRSVARRAAQPRGPEDIPPHLRSAYARVTMAQERGDPRELQAAMLDLERQLQSMPDDFKEQLKPSMQALQKQQLSQKAAAQSRATGAARAALGATGAGGDSGSTAKSALDDQLRQVEEAQSALAGLGEDPAALAKWLESVGITPEEMAMAERAANPQEAMNLLAQRAAAKTVGAGPLGAASAFGLGGGPGGEPIETPQMRAAREGLEEQKARLAEAAKAVEEQKALIEKHRLRTEQLNSQLQEVEKQKAEQGKKVDESVELAKADLANQAKVQQEEDARRHAVVSDLRERGNLAMRNDDKAAARSFYTEALEVPGVRPDERAKLLGNRAACLLALRRPDLALADAEEAVELMPEWGKAVYRLGCLQDDNGDADAAAASLRRACELLPGAADVGARLRQVEARQQKLLDDVQSAEGMAARLAAEAALREAEAVQAEVAHGSATRRHARAASAVQTLAMNPAMREACAEAQEAAEAAEEEAASRAIAAGKAKAEAASARKRAEDAAAGLGDGGGVGEEEEEEEEAKMAMAMFGAAKAAAAKLVGQQSYAEAAEAFGKLIAQCSKGGGKAAGAKPGAKPLPAAFAARVLPGLLSNRAMCRLEAGEAEGCAADCEGALAAIAALQKGGKGAGGEEKEVLARRSLVFKVTLRKAEARRRLGQLQSVRAESAALTAMAATEDERMAAGYLALQCAVIDVE